MSFITTLSLACVQGNCMYLFLKLEKKTFNSSLSRFQRSDWSFVIHCTLWLHGFLAWVRYYHKTIAAFFLQQSNRSSYVLANFVWQWKFWVEEKVFAILCYYRNINHLHFRDMNYKEAERNKEKWKTTAGRQSRASTHKRL